MVKFTKESIQRLRDAVDIVDVISRTVPLKRMGASYKGLCPFHAEKSPSFTVTKASRHYHCFGCGAHGDAVSFLMQQEGFSFTQALEFLSERFTVPLEEDRSGASGKGTDRDLEVKKARLKQINELAREFYHIFLLFSDEAQEAREYLFKRNIPLSFIQAFQIGYSTGPIGNRSEDIPLYRYLADAGFHTSEIMEAGLISQKGEQGRWREFFSQRITFPILDHMGNCIGFSARKIKEETFGGKYINTPETFLFKKSRILFGLAYSKKRIVRERVVILVEGQLDALRLIHAGFDYTVATLGTAFSEQHVDVIKALGVERVYVVFDADEAGISSAHKAGDLLMKKGIGVCVPTLYQAKDPDEFLIRYGRSEFTRLLMEAPDYVEFIITHMKSRGDWNHPHEKERALRDFIAEIKAWDNPILIHEALKKVSQLAEIPVDLIGGKDLKILEKDKLVKTSSFQFAAAFSPIAKLSSKLHSRNQEGIAITPDLELELDLIRWMALMGSEAREIAEKAFMFLDENDFTTAVGKEMFQAFKHLLSQVPHLDYSPGVKEAHSTKPVIELLDIASEVDSIENIESYISYMIGRPPIRLDRSKQYVYEALRKIKERTWIHQREKIRKRMVEMGSQLSEEEQLSLARQFASIQPCVLPPIDEFFP